MAFDTAVFAYSCMKDALALLPSAYRANIRNPRQRVQLEEIDKILSKVSAKTVVAEEYIDRHFIHDFCAHYGSCYFDYPKKCIRIHFFANQFSLDQFKQYVTGDTPDPSGLGNYCGFIVLRPIPGAILGNVSLAVATDPYTSFCIRKKRVAHLCGMELVVETIPFQEQDHAISACATAALWMALHAVPGSQSHNVPPPYRLTENAHKVMVDVMKSHEVTRGLTISQMANAIKEENLMPLTCVPLSTSYLKALVRAYFSMSVPVVFGIELYHRSDSSTQGVSSRKIGYHSVTSLGYAWGDMIDAFDSPDMLSPDSEDEADLYMESSAINAFLCHDDQIGPYSLVAIPDEYSIGFTTEWGRIYSHGPVDARVISVLVPCNSKVRIRFSKIYEIVKSLNVTFYSYYKLMGGYLSWDIQLKNVCDIKKQLREISALDNESRYKLLTLSMPKYIWTVDQYYNSDGVKNKISTFLFDATDIENSDFLIRVIHYNNIPLAMTRLAAKSLKNYSSEQSSPEIVKHIIDLYRDTVDGKFILDEKIVVPE